MSCPCRPLPVTVLLMLPVLLLPGRSLAAEAITTPDVEVASHKLQPLPSLGNAGLDEAALTRLRAGTSDTASLLDGQPGVGLYGNGGVSSLPSIHGLADDRIRIKVDGMDLISACGNHMNPPLSYIDPTNVASIGIFAGIAPVSQGGDSIGGTIRVDSAPPEFAQPGEGILHKARVGTFYRSNNAARGVNLSAAIAGEALSVRYAGSTVRADNYTAARAFKPAGAAAVDKPDRWLDGDEVGSSRYMTTNHMIGFALRRENHLLDLKLGLQDIPYQGFPNQRMDMTANNSRQINLRYEGQYQWGALEARVYNEHTRHKMDFAQDKQFIYAGGGIVAPGMPMDTEGDNTGAVLKADILLTERDILRLGAEAQVYHFDDWWPPSPAVLPSGIPMGGMAPNTFLSINDGERDRLGVFAEWEAHWNTQWTTQLGLRSEAVRMDTGPVHGYNNSAMYGDPAVPTSAPGRFNAADRERTDHNWDLTALARYVPNAMHTFEAGYARKTRSPNLYERYSWSTNTMAMEMINFAGEGNYYVGNLQLKPEVAHTFSATADWHDAEKERWGLKVTPFYTYVDDYIDARRCPAAVCGSSPSKVASLTAKTGFVFLQFVNQSARLYGADVSAYWPLVRTGEYGSFTARSVLSYVNGKNMSTGDHLYNIMPPNLKLAVEHRLGNWTNVAELKLVDAKTQVSEVRNEVKTSGYGLLNLHSSYQWKQARFDLAVDNVLDKFYDLPLGGAYTGQGATMSGGAIPWGIPIPGMGRSINVGLTIDF